MTSVWYEQTGSARQRAAQVLGALDMAPLIDVALLLVIFALVMSGFVFQPGVQVELPAAAQPDAVRGRILTVTITADEQVLVQDSALPPPDAARPLVLRDALAARLGEFYHRDPDGTVVINADYRVRHGYLLQIMEMIRDAGLRRIAFGARDERTPAPATPDANQ